MASDASEFGQGDVRRIAPTPEDVEQARKAWQHAARNNLPSRMRLFNEFLRLRSAADDGEVSE